MDTDLPSIHRSFVSFLAYIFVDCMTAHAHTFIYCRTMYQYSLPSNQSPTAFELDV
jgi:hypothetical protein